MRLTIALLTCCEAAAALAVGNRAYSATYGSAASVDQAAYESADFWKEVAAEIEASVVHAKSSEKPTEADLLTDVYVSYP